VNGPYVELGELDGTHGWVQTSGFVTWVEEVANHVPRQRVRLADDSTDSPVVCTVWTDDITLDKGAGYRLTGADATYERYEEVQLKVGTSSQVAQFYDE
jgi:hypothetical protein